MRKIREWEEKREAKFERNLFADGGGQQQAAPTQQTVTQTSIPEYARPYAEQLLGQAQSLTTSDPYHQYSGQRIAGFTPLQQRAFGSIGAMQPSGAVNQGIAAATNVAQNPNTARFTDPGVASAYMSPYQQNVIDVEKREAMRQAGIAGTQRNAAATGANAFGGSRQAIADSEAARNLGIQLGDIQTRGSQAAYQQAGQMFTSDEARRMQAQQNQLQAAGTLGQLGQTQYGQQMGIAQAQQQAGAQQQNLEQQNLTQQYQDFQNQVRYPYQQLGFMSDILRGMPLTGTASQSLYQAPPSTSNQLLSLGLGAYGIGNLFGGTKGAKEGGAVKSYAYGGGVGQLENNQGVERAMALPEEVLLAVMQGRSQAVPQWVAAKALKMKRMQTAMNGQAAQEKLAGGVGALEPGNVPDERMLADGGIVAFAEGDVVDQDGKPYKTLAERAKVEPSVLSRWWDRMFPAEKPRTILYPEDYGIVARAPEQTSVEALEAGDYGKGPVAAPVAAPAVAPRTGGPARPSGIQSLMPPASAEMPKYKEKDIPVATPEEQSAEIQARMAAMQNLTKPERDALEAAVAERRKKTEGDKEGRLDTARGLAALQAAQALTRPGQHWMTAVGSAFGEAGKEAEKYVNKEAQIRDKLDDADLALKQSQLALKQGDVKLGADLAGKAQEMRIMAAHYAGDNAYKRTLAEAHAAKLPSEIAKNLADAEKDRAMARILIPAQAAAAAMRGQPKELSAKDYMAAMQKATAETDRRIQGDPTLALQIKKNPALRGQLIHQDFSQMLEAAGYEAGPYTAPTSANQLTALPQGAAVAGAVKLPQ